MKKIPFCIFLVFAFSGCLNEETEMYRRFCSQIKGLQVIGVKKILAEGANPDYCVGEFGWIDNNPLFAIPTYLTVWREESNIQKPFPDEEILRLLLEAGADIDARPYIWFKIYINNNDNILKIKELMGYEGELEENPMYKKDVEAYINDINRFLRAFLEAGANPDKQGHPYPFSHEAISKRITDAQANGYFANGTRPINEAIKKGILWESQVDLLLRYTKLDENSLKVAEESGDPAMIEKINTLWKNQGKADCGL